MALMPGAEYVGPIPASNYSTDGTPKIGTVDHVIVGSAASALSEFQDPSAQLSAHFIIAGPGDAWPDGHILQVLDTDLAAYAQAAGNYPPTAYIAKEFSGDPSTPMSAAQMASGAAIDAWAAGVHGFPLVGPVPHGTPGCTTHCNPDGTADPNWGNHSCPGPIRLAQVPQMIAMARGNPTPTPPPPPPPTGDPMPVSPVVSTKAGQIDTFQIAGGALWHKWFAGTAGWQNEPIAGPGGGKSGKTVTLVDGVPQVSVAAGQIFITAESATDGHVWVFNQPLSSAAWSGGELP